MNLVTCPNCKGQSSAHWPLGPCTVCGGTGQTTQEKHDDVILNRSIANAERRLGAKQRN